MNTKRTIGIIGCAVALGSAGCATSRPPADLVQARQAYSASEQSEAARYTPAALHEARDALSNAEAMYKENGESPEVNDAAYIALRRAERAKIEGETIALQHTKEQAERDAAQAQARAAQQAQTELHATRQELQSTQYAREQAEQRAQDAMLQLENAQGASVKKDDRGTVITVAGGFLFPSSKATLLPAANAKLDRVADALKQQEGKKILIEGHTDSRGSSSLNAGLSKQRAEAVAVYLSSRGVPRENITTEGVGPERPIASNDTAEGRASNRRVEIMVQ